MPPLSMSAQTGAASDALAILDQIQRRTREVSAEARRLPAEAAAPATESRAIDQQRERARAREAPEPIEGRDTPSRLQDMPAEDRERFRAIIAEAIAEIGEGRDAGAGGAVVVPSSTGRGGKKRAARARLVDAYKQAPEAISTLRSLTTSAGVIALASRFGKAGLIGGAIGGLVALGMRAITQDFQKQAAASRINVRSMQAIII